MKASITILNTDFEVEYDINITAHGCPAQFGSMNYEGHPAEPAEFEIEFLGLYQNEKLLPLTDWLKEQILQHLYERDDINEIAQKIDHEHHYDD